MQRWGILELFECIQWPLFPSWIFQIFEIFGPTANLLGARQWLQKPKKCFHHNQVPCAENVREAGNFLKIKKRTLDNLCWTGAGPCLHKRGERILDHVDQLKKWSPET
jgi:hypothetical protein